jgi:acid stress-induced BolA-like protein IbaG/YrbA
MDVEQIRLLIQAGLPGAHVEVDGDGRHFSAIVVSGLFAGKSMVQQHQIVYQSLGGKVGNEIHALSIRTFTPEQWDQSQELRVI